MNEENQIQPPVTNTNQGNIAQGDDVVERANVAAQRLEDANRKKEELLAREEQLYAKKLLGGRAEAGTTPIQETPEEAYKRRTQERYKGTGLDPTKHN